MAKCTAKRHTEQQGYSTCGCCQIPNTVSEAPVILNTFHSQWTRLSSSIIPISKPLHNLHHIRWILETPLHILNLNNVLSALSPPSPHTHTPFFFCWWRGGRCLSRSRTIIAPIPYQASHCPVKGKGDYIAWWRWRKIKQYYYKIKWP